MNSRSRRALCNALLLCTALHARSAFAAEDRTPAASLAIDPPAADSNATPAASPTAAPVAPRDDGGDVQPVDPDRAKPEHFRIGVLGGVGLPRPLAVEALVKVERVLGVGVEYSVLPTVSISGVRASFWALAADARVFPLRNAFFIGLRAGYQRLGVSTTVNVEQLGAFPLSAQVDTTFVNPRLGFLWTWEPGFTLGVDAGIQIPLGSEVATTVPAVATGTVVDQEVRQVASVLGQTMLPTLDLLRVGFLL